MKRNINHLGDSEYDVLIIGAGITGAWIALECVLRGLRTIIVEKSDFGAETSSASSRLLHGGIRYLQQLQFHKVRESARERAYYQNAAPHLCRNVRFLIPTYNRARKGKFYLGCGLVLYELLTQKQNRLITLTDKKFKRPAFLNTDRLSKILPAVDPAMTGAFVLQESQMPNSERMTLAIIESVIKYGGHAINYAQANEFIRVDGHTLGAAVTDRLTGKTINCRARVTVNATGPWINGLNKSLDHSKRLQPNTGYSQGSHIIVPRIIDDYAIALPTEYSGANKLDRGGRHIFMIPWNDHTLIGTSYRTIGNDIDCLEINEDEINQLIGTVNSHFPSLQLSAGDILHSFSGIYPLQDINIDESVYQGTGDYQILDHQHENGDQGMVSALGAKYTTARLVGEKTADKVVSKLGTGNTAPQTRSTRLASAPSVDNGSFASDLQALFGEIMDRDTITGLVASHGTNAAKILEMCRENRRFCLPLSTVMSYITAQVHYAVQHEMAVCLEDVMFRRTHLGIFDHHPQTAKICADIMAPMLNWDNARIDDEIMSLRMAQSRHCIQGFDRSDSDKIK